MLAGNCFVSLPSLLKGEAAHCNGFKCCCSELYYHAEKFQSLQLSCCVHAFDPVDFFLDLLQLLH
jgi:hypothetical protein